jgi:hypothetical protein
MNCRVIESVITNKVGHFKLESPVLGFGQLLFDFPKRNGKILTKEVHSLLLKEDGELLAADSSGSSKLLFCWHERLLFPQISIPGCQDRTGVKVKCALGRGSVSTGSFHMIWHYSKSKAEITFFTPVDDLTPPVLACFLIIRFFSFESSVA